MKRVMAPMVVAIVVGCVAVGLYNVSKVKHETLTVEQKRAQIRDASIRKFYSPWDGSFKPLVEAVKGKMKNPPSFDHVNTLSFDGVIPLQGQPPVEEVLVYMVYRGTNSYGAVVTEEAYAILDTRYFTWKEISGEYRFSGKCRQRKF